MMYDNNRYKLESKYTQFMYLAYCRICCCFCCPALYTHS
jgi:hypothetical protein